MLVLYFKYPHGSFAGDADAELLALAAKGLKHDFVLLTQDISFMEANDRLVGHEFRPLPTTLIPAGEIWYRRALNATLLFSAEWGPNGGPPAVLRVLSVTFSQIPTTADVQTCCQRHNAGTVAFT